MINKKQLWMLVGGNGSGKSTFFEQFLKSLGIQFVNEDQIAKNISAKEPENVSYQAARIAENIRAAYLRSGLSFCFETVFSHPSKIDFMAEAKAFDYEIIMVFIHLDNNQLNQSRVNQRVSEGGHNVPSEKITSRIPRTLANVKKALPLADMIYILDNSLKSDPYQRVATIKNGRLNLYINPIPDWASVVLSDFDL